jgi:hypothetical protein
MSLDLGALVPPVVLIVFNRPNLTRTVFDAVSQVRPTSLFVIADGARNGKPGEEELCRQVRTVCSQVDWPCEVHTNFSDSNLGCRDRVVSGLDWVFSLVEEAIILEDDCLPDPSFFPYCRELLDRYRGDPRISMISGTNMVEKDLKTDYSYFFCQLGYIWGWATWRSAWQRYDRNLARWPEVKQSALLDEIFENPESVAYWSRTFDQMHTGTGVNTWDFQWIYTTLINNALTIVPSVNLISNIGFGPDATHTTTPSAVQWFRKSRGMEFPLKHPPALIPLRAMDSIMQGTLFQPAFRQRIVSRLRRLSSGRQGEARSAGKR